MCATHDGALRSPAATGTVPATRVAVVGKGGVGKTTLTALLARVAAAEGARVIAVDADGQQNLAATLGFNTAERHRIVPITEQAALLDAAEAPTADVIERLAVEGPDGVRLVVMGSVRHAGDGCLCPQTALLGSAIAAMGTGPDDVVVMDTHAGVEHFGRGLARGFQAAVVVVDPTLNAIDVGARAADLAQELGIDELHLVVNRCRATADIEHAATRLDGGQGHRFRSITAIPDDAAAAGRDPTVDRLLRSSALASAARTLAWELLPLVVGRREGR